MHTKPTVLDLFGLHFPENRYPRGYLANPYGDLHEEALDSIFNTLNLAPSKEQRRLWRHLTTTPGATLGIRAVAGGGKTKLLSALCIALLRAEKLRPNEAIVWIVKTRKMRDKQVTVFRELLEALWGRRGCDTVIGVGRATNENSHEEDYKEFDAYTKQRAQDLMTDERDTFFQLSETLKLKKTEPMAHTDEFREWREMSAACHKSGLRLFDAKLENIQYVIHRAQIIVMTADGFGQLQAEDTPMAAWFKTMKVRACVVDEAHTS